MDGGTLAADPKTVEGKVEDLVEAGRVEAKQVLEEVKVQDKVRVLVACITAGHALSEPWHTGVVWSRILECGFALP